MSIRLVGNINGALKVDYDSTNGMRVYRYLYNAHSASRAAGLVCCYDHTATSYFGMQVKQPATANLAMLAGVHIDTVTSGAWAWVQVDGYHSAVSARRYADATNSNALAGDVLKTINGVDAVVYDSTGGGTPTYHAYLVRIASCASASNSTIASSVTAIIKAF